MSFHNYCLGAAPGLPQFPDPTGACENVGETLVFQNADAHSGETGSALLMTEFGDTEDTAIHARVADLADRFMVGWTNWAYMGSTGQIKIDNAAPPTPDNIRQARLDAIVRAYPRLIAGTPLAYDYDPRPRRFEAVWSTELPDGNPAGPLESELFLPQRHYGSDYRVEVSGAEVVGGLGTQVLRLRNCPGMATVRVAVTDEASVQPPACVEQSEAPGGRCANAVNGTQGPDRLAGTSDGDRIFGFAGRDVLRGVEGDDCLWGQRGRDRLGGGTGEDALKGARGRDRLRGGLGFDVIEGGVNTDVIRARDGTRDAVDCGPGNDRVRADARDSLRSCERVRRPR
jgi:Ca2+-binding RTX toxin-like protein